MTTLTKTLVAEIEAAPPELQQEVFAFIELLKARHSPGVDGESLLPLAHRTWAADWESP